jgi:hypothetical protein
LFETEQARLAALVGYNLALLGNAKYHFCFNGLPIPFIAAKTIGFIGLFTFGNDIVRGKLLRELHKLRNLLRRNSR